MGNAPTVGHVPDVVFPCLNEAAALPALLSSLPAGYRAIVADNGSTDGSAAIARGLGAMVVDVPERGFGAAAHGGLLAASDEVVCFCDADGSFDPAQLPLVADPVLAGSADLVLGRRVPVQRGAFPTHARVSNRILARTIRSRTGLLLSDLGPMRGARRESLLALDLADRRFGYPLEVVVRAHQQGWRIREVDVDYRLRAAGTRSKVSGTVRGCACAMVDMRAVLAR